MSVDQIEKLREIKKRRGLSYDELGHEIGVHSMSVYRWLKYGRSPKSRAVRRAVDQFLDKTYTKASGLTAKKRLKKSKRGQNS
ncbi:MAG: helix-turn-helix domain-containing protein [Candidatus Omnitrophica bacterium]|nr:helix-turn-helix domain-containing protein [Candidatus Omnitrophota bacterium]